MTSDSVTLKWDAPKRDGGSKITSYSIEKRQGHGRWFKANLTDVHDCQYTVTGLAINERYEFRVIARNAIGVVSPPSNSSGMIAARSENCEYLQDDNRQTGCHIKMQDLYKCTLHFTLFFFPPAYPNIEFGPEYFEGLTVKAGDSIRLKVTITGRPVPKVVWFRNDVEITKKMMDIVTIPGSSTLFVRDADRTHSGLYAIEATNGSGTKKESILVQVQGNSFDIFHVLKEFKNDFVKYG